MRDTLFNKVKALNALNATAISTNSNTDGIAVGLGQAGQNYKSVMFVAACTARTDGSFALVPQESADSATGWTNVPAARMQGSAALSAVNTVAEIGVIPDPGVASFVRLRVTASGVTAGGTVTAVALLGSPSVTPIR